MDRLFCVKHRDFSRPTFTTDQVATVRYLIDTGVITPDSKGPYHYLVRDALCWAARIGSCTLIDLLIVYGVTTKDLDVALAAALIREVELQHLFIIHVSHHLIAKGALVTEAGKLTADIVRAHVDKKHLRCTLWDDMKATVLVSYYAMKHGLPRASVIGSLKLVQLVVNGKLKVLAEPLPFFDMA